GRGGTTSGASSQASWPTSHPSRPPAIAPPAAPPPISAAFRSPSPLLLTPSPPPAPPRAAPQTGSAHLQYLSCRIAVHPASRTASITATAFFRTMPSTLLRTLTK